MKQEIFENNHINDVKFAPYEDFVGLGLDNGKVIFFYGLA